MVFGDVTMSQFIEISHEFGHSYSLFFNDPAQSWKQVGQIVGSLVPNSGFGLSGLIRKILEGVSMSLGEGLSNLIVLVDISDELIIVDIGQITSIHVLFEN